MRSTFLALLSAGALLLLLVLATQGYAPRPWPTQLKAESNLPSVSPVIVKSKAPLVGEESHVFPLGERCHSSKFLVVTADTRPLCNLTHTAAWGLAREMIDRVPDSWPLNELEMKQVYCAMNKVYLARHNISLRVVDYSDPSNHLPTSVSALHSSWRKLWVMEQALADVKDGTVVLWMDSDAIFHDHSMSFCNFFARLTERDLVGEGAFKLLPYKSLFFGTTADPLHYHPASHYHDVEDHNNFSAIFLDRPFYNTLNAGVFWLRNTEVSRKFLKAWKNECEPPTKTSCRKEWAWEQQNLVNILKPFQAHVAVFRATAFQGPNGQFIRHLWDGIDSKLEFKYFMWTLRQNQHLLPPIFGS